jgi:hypothetical protein
VRLLAAIVGLAALSMPTVAWTAPQASTSTGSIIRSPQAASIPDGGPNTRPAALKVMRAFGRCAAQNRQLSEKLLEALPSSEEEQSAALWMSKSECLNGGTLRFRANLLRGVVAEYLFSRMNLATAGDWARMDIFAVPDAEALAQADPAQRAAIQLIGFGQCVATKDMDSVKALLTTQPNTAEEGAAFAKLGPTLGGCAEKGVSLKLNRFELRGYLAEGAYRAMVLQSKEAGRAQG